MAGELYGDYSRMPTVIGSGVRSVFAQQGRVVLDSDVNEQTALLLQQIRSIAGDLIGPHGGPRDNVGFEITFETDPDGNDVLGIAKGRYYVDGIQVDAGETTYFEQGAFLDPDEDDDELPAAPFLVYLKVWERTIGAIEDPATREVALGPNGPDTTTRNRVVWQVLASPDVFGHLEHQLDTTKKSFLDAWDAWAQDATPRGMLMARANRPTDADDDPCPTPPTSRYRGVENQLYRVEIHTVDVNANGVMTATFKWSRDNGSATYPIASLVGRVATVTSLGRDRGLMVDIGDWVEVVDDRYMVYPGVGPLGRRTSELIRVVDVDALDRTVTLGADPQDGVGEMPERHPFLRRWDQQCRSDSTPTGLFESNGCEVEFTEVGGDPIWIDLEDGIQVAFESGVLRVGDYWLIAARTETGDIEWPQEAGGPKAMPPLGVDYAFAPLAVVRGTGTVDDLRLSFAPLAK